jgi:hypothetical protein
MPEIARASLSLLSTGSDSRKLFLISLKWFRCGHDLAIASMDSLPSIPEHSESSSSSSKENFLITAANCAFDISEHEIRRRLFSDRALQQ